MSKRRIISLLPSCTEIVGALGCGDWLVGRSHECDYPPGVRTLPVCTRAKLNAEASSAEIDREVKSLLEQALSIYDVDAAQLEKLRPQIILTQSQCEVCAVSVNDLEEALRKTVGLKAGIISVAPMRLTDVWKDIQTIADALGVAEEGREVLSGLKHRVVNIIEKTCMMTQRPTVACVEWLEPLMAAGNWVPELVEFAGGKNLFGEAGKHSPWMEWPALVKTNPDIIVLMPCGFDLARVRKEMTVLEQKPEWKKLRAVKSGKVFLVDGNQYFNRPGPRLVESLEILAEICQPKIFSFGHEGKGWEKLQPHA